MGLSKQDVADITAGWMKTMAETQETILKSGGFNWQLFKTLNSPTQEECAATFRDWCADKSMQHNETLYYAFDKTRHDHAQTIRDIAGFQLIRGDYAFLGYGWLGCTSGPDARDPKMPYTHYGLPAATQVDYGTPSSGQCKETKPGSGVFEREFTKANISFDCNKYNATIQMKS